MVANVLKMTNSNVVITLEANVCFSANLFVVGREVLAGNSLDSFYLSTTVLSV